MPSTASTTYQDYIEGKLLTAIATGTTTGVTYKIKQVNGATPTHPTAAHRLKIVQRTATGTKVEKMNVAAGTTQSGQTVTLGTLTRALPLSNGTDFTGSGTAQSFAAGADVFLAWDSHDAAQSAKLDIANTFTTHQTISSTNELRFADSATAVWDDGTSLSFKDSTTATKTLAQLAAAAGTDEKVGVSINDTTPDYLLNKLAAGTGITLTETNDGGDEDVTIAAVNTVATGHTGLSTVTTGGLLVGAGTSNMTIIGPGTNGQVPMSNGTTIAMAQVVPVGTLAMWGTDTAPTNWLLCYGQAVSRTTYSALFAVVSTAFGVGDGSSTFNLPDMRGRFPLGQDDMGGSSANRVTATEADTVGSAAGTADGAHTHSIATAGANPGGGATSVVTNVTGSTSIMPPYLTLNYIIYAAA